MTRAEIVEARDQFIREHGPWTGHRIHLGHGVYTCEDNPAYCLDYRMGLHLQALEDADLAVIRDIRDLSGVRILDLGCHEGAFAIEFAKRGADVVGIDARASNIEHAHFAASVIGLDDQMAPLGCCRFQVLDVRSLLSLEHFDVVLCAGILYHRRHPMLFRNAANIGNWLFAGDDRHTCRTGGCGAAVCAATRRHDGGDG